MSLCQQKPSLFLYSQDLSNYKTPVAAKELANMFLYSQDLSNYKTLELEGV